MNNLLSEFFISSIGGYLTGSLPVGPAIVYGLTGKNIFHIGSRNAGATNVGRLLGAPYFLLVLLLDAVKSYLFLSIFYTYCSHEKILIGLAALALLLGNRYSLFLHAQGGKGVATSLGIMLFLFSIPWVCTLLAVWCIVLMVTKKIGIASSAAACACLLLSAVCLVTCYASYEYYVACIASIHVLYCHKSHIVHLLHTQ